MSNLKLLSSSKDKTLDENILEYLRISDQLDTEIQSKGDYAMLENLIDMFNYSSKVADKWADLPEDFNLLEADFDLKEDDSAFEDSDSEYSDESLLAANLDVEEDNNAENQRPSFTDLA
jgi:hypothetical protein